MQSPSSATNLVQRNPRAKNRGALQRSVLETLESRVLLSGNGLVAQYFNGNSFTGTSVYRTDPTLNLSWANGAPDNSMPVDGYSAQWTGQVQPLYSETYTFSITAQGGGALLNVNGTTLISQLSATGGTWTGSIALTANSKYAITVQYAEKSTTNSGLSLSWSSASQTLQVIPQSQLYSFSDIDFNGGNTPGSSSYDTATGTLTVNGAGGGVLFNGSEDCHFTYQTMSGDVDIIARVTSGSKAGLIIRDGLSGNAATGNLLSPNGGQQWMVARPTAGSGITGGVGGAYTDPVWLRLTKSGNLLTGYSSTDGVNWAVVWSGQDVNMGSTVYAGFFSYSGSGSTLATATFDNIKITTTNWGFATSWLGNTFGGPNKFVQNDIKGIFVTSDGTVIVNSPYDEGGHEAAVYKNGQFIGELLDTIGGTGSLHGWGRAGGWGVTADSTYIYITMVQDNQNCIRRYSLSTRRAAPFTGGIVDGSIKVVNTAGGSLRGLYLDGTSLYVSDMAANTVFVYSTVDMSLQRSFTVTSPKQITKDQNGLLWIISAPSGSSPSVLCYSTAGVLQSKSITTVASPTGVAINPTNGYLLVSDDGPSQQVHVFNISGTSPVLVSDIGVYGGVGVASTNPTTIPGQVSPLKFNYPGAVGVDGSGNIFVGFNGVATSVTSAIGLGSVLRSFSPSLTLNWEVDGLIFVDAAAADPGSDGLDVYTPTQRFSMDYSKNLGQEATWVGESSATNVYGSDTRDTGGASSVWVQYMLGQRFIFTTSQNGGGIDFYRFIPGTEIAVRAGTIALYGVIGNQAYSQIARDLNGNGQLESNEWTYSSQSGSGSAWGIDIDTQGNVWVTSMYSTSIRKYVFQGLDGFGNPIYSGNAVLYNSPAEFGGGAGKSMYDPATDTMYIAGYSTLHPKQSGDNTWGVDGTELIRYNNWSTNPTLAWRNTLPYDVSVPQAPYVVKSMSLAGNRIFGAITTTGTNVAYDTATGALVATMPRGPEIGGLGGWLDTLQAMNAYRRSNGEYITFTEDDLLGKVSIIRVGGIAPSNLSGTPVGTTQVNLSWTDNCTSESGFVVQQSTDGVNYTTIATLPANLTAYSATGLTTGVNYSFRVKATNWFEDSPYTTPVSAFFPSATTAPTNVTATAGTGQVSLTWTDNATTETAYKVDRSTDPTFATGTTTFSLAVNATSYTDTGLAYLTKYYYRVYAMNGTTNLGYSKTVSAVTLQTTPTAPSNFLALALNSTQITLSWTDNSSNETSFVIQRATDLNFTQNLKTALTSAPNATSYLDAGLTANTTYFYRIYASNSAGSSAVSSVVSTRTAGSNDGFLGLFTTTADIGAPGAVGSAAATSDGKYLVGGAGTDIWGTADGFRYLYNTISGDITMTARMDFSSFSDTWAKAGIIVRATTDPGSPMIMVGTRQDGQVFWEWRLSQGAAAIDSGWLVGGATYPKWVKLVRSGSNYSGYYSTDGTNWTQIGSTQAVPNIPTSALIGLADSSHVTGTLNTEIYGAVTSSTSTAPTGLSLAASSDTGTIGDGITTYNNSSPGTALTFNVTGTISGATLYLYADGLLIGTGTASGSTSTLTSDGSTTLSYASHNFTVQQIVPGWPASAISSATAVTIQSAAPATPTGLAATTASSSQINLTWNAVSGATSYNIYRSTTPGGEGSTAYATGIATTSYSNTGLSAGTTYYYTVAAVNAGGTSAQSSEVSAITIPAQATGLAATAASTTQINLTWTAVTGAATYNLYRSTTPGGEGSTPIVTGITTASYSNTGLTAGTTYYYKVAAVNAGGTGAQSTEASAITVPAQTTGLNVTVVSSTQLNLSWTATTGAATYNLYRSTTSGGEGSTPIVTGIATTSYSNTGLTANTAYFYKVAAVNAGGTGAQSTEATATTLPNAPAAPSGLTATTISQTQINLAWTDNSTNETGFKIERATDSGFTTNLTLVTTTAANAVSYSNTGLTANTQYYYRVRATNTGGDSANSASANATTLPLAPTAPSGLAATAVSSSQINLAWTDNSTNETGFKVERATDSGFTTNLTLVTTTAANATSYSNTGLNASTTYYYRVRATNTGGDSANTSTASATTLTSIPAPWTTSDIGTVGLAGSANYSSGTYTLTASGADIWNNSDAFRFVYQPLTGDGQIVAHVASFSGSNVWAKTGVMIRETLTAGSTHASTEITTGNGLAFQYRPTTAGATTHVAGSLVNAPIWVKMVRQGNTFTSSSSSDGVTWTTIGSTTITMASTVYLGIIDCSHDDASIATATIDNVTATLSPSAPSGLTATTISQTQINLAWTDNSNNETGFKVERATDSGFTTNLTLVTTTAANATSYSDTSTVANTQYYYRIRATNSGVDSTNSASATATTLPNTPTAPSGLSATTISQTQINLAWTDNSSNETGFKVERATDSGFTTNLTLVTTTAANATSYSNTGLTANTQYFYRVRATNTGGDSANSASANATTLANTPTAPSGLAAATVSQTQINLTWTDNSTNETGFKVERATDSSFTQNLTLVTTTAANATSYSDTGLTASSTYYYRVRATNASGDSANSNAVLGATQSGVAITTTLNFNDLSTAVIQAANTDPAVPGATWGYLLTQTFVYNVGNGVTATITNGTAISYMDKSNDHTPSGTGIDIFSASDITVTFSAPVTISSFYLGDLFGGDNSYAAVYNGTTQIGSTQTVPIPSHSFTSNGINSSPTQAQTMQAVTAFSSVLVTKLVLTSDLYPQLDDLTVVSTPAPVQLTGALITPAGATYTTGNGAANAFDNNLSTFVDATASSSWVGLDLVTVRTITSLSFAPRATYASRMVGGYFQVSNVADFSTATTIYTISAAPTDGVLTSVNVSVSGTWRFVRYVGPTGAYCNLSELQFLGY